MDFTFVETIVLNYLKKHPELVERIVHRILDDLLEQLSKS